MKKTLILSLIAICSFMTTDAFAVIGHPVLHKQELSKKEKRQHKRQQKLIGFAEKLLSKKMDRFIARHQLFSDSTKCDTLVLRNGRKLVVNINKISNEGISYKSCNQPNTPEIILSNAAVREIIYANGERNKIDNLVFDRTDNPSETVNTDVYNFVLDSSRCDTIILRNGKQIIANILQILPNEVEYRRCNHSKNTNIRLSKRAIKEIRYLGGQTDRFDTTSVASSPSPHNSAILDRQLRKAKSTGLLVGILSGLLSGWLIGLVGILVLFLIYQNRDKQVRKRAMKYAWIGWGIVMLTLLVILVVAILINI